MNKKLLVVVGVVALLSGCSTISPTTSPTTSPSVTPSSSSPTSPSPQLIIGCYGVWQGKNHYNVEILTYVNTQFTGLMTYDNYQFDSSQGSFDGYLTDGILLGVYRFTAEGSANERELIFKQSGDALIQGFGDMEMDNGREIFVDPATVTWDPRFTYTRESQCPALWK
jgi:hypothetical protein